MQAVNHPLSLSTAIVIVLTLFVLPVNSLCAASSNAKPQAIKDKRIEPNAKMVEELDPRDFDRSENIDNPWMPLAPGKQFVFEGYAEEEGKKIPHRIVFTVTDLVKVIGGVRTRVIYDTDMSDGKFVEKELTFFAQDKVGNVWHLGQYREVYDDEFVGGRIWYVGNPEGAKAGIMMLADPKVGTPSYSEGYAPPPFNWTDRGRVYKTNQKTKVPAGSYDDVLIIEEFDAEHLGDMYQLKYYARGVGNVRIGWKGKQAVERENLQLISVRQLDAKGLAEARAAALELEKRAMMYSKLPPAE